MAVLPYDVLLMIAEGLDKTTLIRLRSVCRPFFLVALRRNQREIDTTEWPNSHLKPGRMKVMKRVR
jgi:hypothetical protein